MELMSPSGPASSPPTPSRTYLLVTGALAAVGLGLGFAVVVHPLVSVVSMLPLLIGLQQIGVRKRVGRQEKKQREQA